MEEIDMDKVLAIILAGGRGKRMDILCYDRAKPILPFAGRFRVIDFVLSNCIHSGIRDIAVLTDYHRSDFANYLKHWHAINARRQNIHVLQPTIGPHKGTADAVYQSHEYLQNHQADTILVLAADHIYSMDYRKMLAFHEQAGADLTVGMVAVPAGQASRFGIAKTDAQSRIADFIEKPSTPRSGLASMGIYVFDKKVLLERVMEDAAQPLSPHDFGQAIIPQMVKQNRVFAYKFDGYWQDIGTVEAYYQANMELMGRLPALVYSNEWPVLTSAINLRSPKVTARGSVTNSIISSGCVINGHIENSILSPGVRIEEEAVVRDSVVMTNSFVGEYSVVERSILDEGVSIGRFCYIGFGTNLVPGDRGITMVGKGVTVPGHTAIGYNCKIMPGVGAEDFAKSAIHPNMVIEHRQSLLAKNKLCLSVR